MKRVGRLQLLARALERQDAAVVGERMQHDGHVLARLDDLVEIADAALSHRAGERAVRPDRVAALQQVAAGEVGGGEIVVAGDGMQRQAEPGRHVGDEAGLAAARRALRAAAAGACARQARTARIRCRPGRSREVRRRVRQRRAGGASSIRSFGVHGEGGGGRWRPPRRIHSAGCRPCGQARRLLASGHEHGPDEHQRRDQHEHAGAEPDPVEQRELVLDVHVATGRARAAGGPG